MNTDDFHTRYADELTQIGPGPKPMKNAEAFRIGVRLAELEKENTRLRDELEAARTELDARTAQVVQLIEDDKHTQSQLAAAREALRAIKLVTLTYGNGQAALAQICRLCIDAGITEKLDALAAITHPTDVEPKP